jgi:hypothetical protein
VIFLGHITSLVPSTKGALLCLRGGGRGGQTGKVEVETVQTGMPRSVNVQASLGAQMSPMSGERLEMALSVEGAPYTRWRWTDGPAVPVCHAQWGLEHRALERVQEGATGRGRRSEGETGSPGSDCRQELLRQLGTRPWRPQEPAGAQWEAGGSQPDLGTLRKGSRGRRVSSLSHFLFVELVLLLHLPVPHPSISALPPPPSSHSKQFPVPKQMFTTSQVK